MSVPSLGERRSIAHPAHAPAFAPGMPSSLALPPTGSSSGSTQRPQSRVSNATRLSQSVSSQQPTLASSARSRSASADTRDRQRTVHTLPRWIHAADADGDEDEACADHDGSASDATSHLLPRTPISARAASHHYMPTPKSTVPGRKYDHIREGAPVTLSTPVSHSASKWKHFTHASSPDPSPQARGHIVDDDWLAHNLPDLEQKWEPMDAHADNPTTSGFWLFSTAKRTRTLVDFHNTVMNHPMVPALIRMVVLTFSILALALASSIYRRSYSHSCDNNSSTWMAIIVDIVAILYTVYITYDEYTSKPLGLRSHNAKMALIFLDLAFIVFESANLSLAFQTLTDVKWACVESSPQIRACPYTKSICQRQQGLTATLFIALLAWIGTFTISTLRLIHRVAR